jgi:hypothetical protein
VGITNRYGICSIGRLRVSGERERVRAQVMMDREERKKMMEQELEVARELERGKETIVRDERDGEARTEIKDERAHGSELDGKRQVANSPFISPSPPQLVLPNVDAESPPRTRDSVDTGQQGGPASRGM